MIVSVQNQFPRPTVTKQKHKDPPESLGITRITSYNISSCAKVEAFTARRQRHRERHRGHRVHRVEEPCVETWLALATLYVAYGDLGVTYMKVRLTKETTSIIAQLGTTLSPQRAYAIGTATPYWASSPSKGWKYPSFLPNWLLLSRVLYSSKKVSLSVVVRFMRLM